MRCTMCYFIHAVYPPHLLVHCQRSCLYCACTSLCKSYVGACAPASCNLCGRQLQRTHGTYCSEPRAWGRDTERCGVERVG